jgi:hypothetical protein
MLAEAPAIGQFFTPVSSDVVDGLIVQYRDLLSKIDVLSALVSGDLSAVVGYFVKGNSTPERGYSRLAADAIFERNGAVAELNSSFWSKALALTDVRDCMPAKRREEWDKQIRENGCPDFEEETVRATLKDLLFSRARFLAERVDGIFRELSGEHVTNSPMGFGKRMILAGIHTGFYTTERVGYINDLRCVIAKFMGRDEPKWNGSSGVVNIARKNHGEWITVDGGALRIRCYIKGTAHLEVHPDMAWRLNCILHELHPRAIPSEFRQKPKKKAREFQMIQRPLPFAVLEVLGDLEPAYTLEKTGDWRREYRRVEIPNALKARIFSDDPKNASMQEVYRVLAAIGGVQQKEGHWQFDYPPGDAISAIICSGCLPDQKTHQYYPTPEKLARIAVEMADIGPLHSCLEPSAGQGGLAEFMPKERARCCEISGLHCEILKHKGFDVVCRDFLQWAGELPDRYDRIVMNPPFSDGRARSHVEAAAGLLAINGRLVAIVPASMLGKLSLPSCSITWSETFNNEFAGTSASVVILTADRCA